MSYLCYINIVTETKGGITTDSLQGTIVPGCIVKFTQAIDGFEYGIIKAVCLINFICYNNIYSYSDY